MSSWKQTKKREANGASLGLWLKIIAVLLFFGALFALGVNPFSDEFAEGSESGVSAQ